MIKFLLAHITLRPYGDNLLTTEAKHSLFRMGVIAFITAMFEGLIWGSLVYFFFSYGRSKELITVVSVVVGIAAFVIMWIIDTTLIGSDISFSIFDKNAWRQHTTKMIRIAASLGTRVALVLATAYVTAPQLAALTMSDDTLKEIEVSNQQKRADLYKKVEEEHNTRILDFQNKLIELRNLLDAEISGTRASGTKGNGPVSKNLRERISTDSLNIVSLVLEKNNELHQIEASSLDTLQQRYSGFTYEKPTPAIKKKYSDALLKVQGNDFIAVLAKLAVWLLFAALLILKLLNRDDQYIYLDVELQEKFQDYLNGYIDAYYFADWKDELIPIKPDISPYVFKSWYYEIFLPRRVDLQNDQHLHILGLNLNKLNNQEQDIRNNLLGFLQTRQSLLDSLQEVQARLNISVDSRSRESSAVDRLSSWIDDSANIDLGTLDLENIYKLQNTQNVSRTELAASKTRLVQIGTEIANDELAISLINTRLAGIEETIRLFAESELNIIDQQHGLRKEYYEKIGVTE